MREEIIYVSKRNRKALSAPRVNAPERRNMRRSEQVVATYVGAISHLARAHDAPPVVAIPGDPIPNGDGAVWPAISIEEAHRVRTLLRESEIFVLDAVVEDGVMVSVHAVVFGRDVQAAYLQVEDLLPGIYSGFDAAKQLVMQEQAPTYLAAVRSNIAHFYDATVSAGVASGGIH